MHWNLIGEGSFLLMGMRKDVCNNWSLALEINWVRLLYSNGNEKRRLRHMESCTGIWLWKALLMGMRKDDCNVWSLALEIYWVRLLASNGNEKRRLQRLESSTAVLLGKTPPFVMRMRKDV